MWKTMRLTSTAGLIVMALLISVGTVPTASAQEAGTKPKKGAASVVYVCTCKKDHSCECYTMATEKGKCACGAESPEMKAVPRNSKWARENRKGLS